MYLLWNPQVEVPYPFQGMSICFTIELRFIRFLMEILVSRENSTTCKNLIKKTALFYVNKNKYCYCIQSICDIQTCLVYCKTVVFSIYERLIFQSQVFSYVNIAFVCILFSQITINILKMNYTPLKWTIHHWNELYTIEINYTPLKWTIHHWNDRDNMSN